jgi:phospholipase C
MRSHWVVTLLYVWLFVSPIALAAANTTPVPPTSGNGDNATPIEHVIVLMMENRSFDHYLGWLHEGRPSIDGIIILHLTCLPLHPQYRDLCLFGHYNISPYRFERYGM